MLIIKTRVWAKFECDYNTQAKLEHPSKTQLELKLNPIHVIPEPVLAWLQAYL